MSGILGSPILEVAIGLAYVYLLLAVFCSTVNEWISGLLNKRGKVLEQALLELLDDQPQAATPGAGAAPQAGLQFHADFNQHALIKGLKSGGHMPSYLSPATFATAVMDIATVGKQGAITFADLESGVKAMPDGDVKSALLALLQNCNNDLEMAQQRIEAWFTEFMDRVSGWYKRWIQVLTVVMALAVTLALNVDTLKLAKAFWTDSTVRTELIDQAKAAASAPPPATSVPNQPPAMPQLPSALDELVGWHAGDLPPAAEWPTWILGLLLTTVAVSLGAPFWFDTLKRIMNLRAAGQTPDERAQQNAKAAT
jgi:hypothetical protein